MTPLLQVDALTLRAGNATLAENLSFAVAAGERFGLVGESGSGKSLTALAITRLLSPAIRATGRVTLGDIDVLGSPERTLNGLRGVTVATVFQEPLTALDPLMPLGRQIALPVRRRLRRDGQTTAHRAAVNAEVSTLMEQVRLPDPDRIVRAFPHEVSGGQRQRVAIAMALACRPRLLIADEPTTALDVTTQAEIVKLLDALVRDSGIALLFISHDLPVVGMIADRVLVLRDGREVESGETRQVLTAPREDYTRSLVKAARRFDAALEKGR